MPSLPRKRKLVLRTKYAVTMRGGATEFVACRGNKPKRKGNKGNAIHYDSTQHEMQPKQQSQIQRNDPQPTVIHSQTTKVTKRKELVGIFWETLHLQSSPWHYSCTRARGIALVPELVTFHVFAKKLFCTTCFCTTNLLCKKLQ